MQEYHSFHLFSVTLKYILGVSYVLFLIPIMGLSGQHVYSHYTGDSHFYMKTVYIYWHLYFWGKVWIIVNVNILIQIVRSVCFII